MCDIARAGTKKGIPQYREDLEKHIIQEGKALDPARGTVVVFKPSDDPALEKICQRLLKMQGVPVATAGIENLRLYRSGFKIDLMPLFRKNNVDLLVAGYGTFAAPLVPGTAKTKSAARSSSDDVIGASIQTGVAVGIVKGILPAPLAIAPTDYSSDPSAGWALDIVQMKYLMTNYKGEIMDAFFAYQKTDDPEAVQELLNRDAKASFIRPLAMIQQRAK